MLSASTPPEAPCPPTGLPQDPKAGPEDSLGRRCLLLLWGETQPPNPPCVSSTDWTIHHSCPGTDRAGYARQMGRWAAGVVGSSPGEHVVTQIIGNVLVQFNRLC